MLVEASRRYWTPRGHCTRRSDIDLIVGARYGVPIALHFKRHLESETLRSPLNSTLRKYFCGEQRLRLVTQTRRTASLGVDDVRRRLEDGSNPEAHLLQIYHGQQRRLPLSNELRMTVRFASKRIGIIFHPHAIGCQSTSKRFVRTR